MAAPTFEHDKILALVVVASPFAGAVGRTLVVERDTLVVLGRTRDEHTATASMGKAAQRRLELEDQRCVGDAMARYQQPLLSPIDALDRVDDFNITDDAVSQTHAMVLCDGTSVVVVDVQSRNGTWHNGERVSVAALVAGDVLRLGETRLEARVVDDN
jgi:hypothetical protein